MSSVPKCLAVFAIATKERSTFSHPFAVTRVRPRSQEAIMSRVLPIREANACWDIPIADRIVSFSIRNLPLVNNTQLEY